MHLITGYAGEEHITSNDIGTFQSALTDGKNTVLVWDGFAIEKITQSSSVLVNKVKAKQGFGICEGRVFNNEIDTEITLQSVAVGYYERDLIVARYQRDTSTNVESISLVAIAGTPSTRQQGAENPSYTEGSISAGDATVDFPIASVLRSYSSVDVTMIAKTIDETYIDEDYIESKIDDFNIQYGGGVGY